MHSSAEVSPPCRRCPLNSDPVQLGRWTGGDYPPNVELGTNTVVMGDTAFKRFYAKGTSALRIGANCTMDGVHFAIGPDGKLQVGNFCYFTNAVLLCELT